MAGFTADTAAKVNSFENHKSHCHRCTCLETCPDGLALLEGKSKYSRLDLEVMVKQRLMVSVNKIVFDDITRSMRVFCDTDHSALALKTVDAVAQFFGTGVSISAAVIDGDPMVVLSFYPPYKMWPDHEV